ncbi:MAG TPA: CsbD family protein [Anaerolineales bacterium]|nr:CsbD family protein [Anaerolineales bacterium]
MNRDLLTGSWRELRGQVKARWGKLTDDDMAKIEGRLDQLVGAVQKRYGYAREEAEREIEVFLDDVQRRLQPQAEE